MNRKLPAVVLVTTADLAQLNGPAIHFLNLASALSALGHDVRIMAPDPGKDLIVTPHCDVAVVLTPNLRRWRLPATLSIVAMVPFLRRATERVLYVRASPATGYLQAFLPRKSNTGSVVEFNGWLPDEAQALGYSAWTQWMLAHAQIRGAKSADHIRAVTEGIKRTLVENGIDPTRIAVIGNGTDTSIFTPLAKLECRERLRLLPEESVAAFLGNLWPIVDFETLFEAIAELADQGQRVKLLIAGDGPRHAELVELAASVLPSDRVIFYGAMPQAEANVVLGAADVLVAPYVRDRNERVGLSPLKIRDYAAAGRPIVATSFAGISELGSEPWMFLAEPEDTASFARALATALSSELAASGIAARRYAEDHWSWTRIASTVSDLISQAADTPSHR